MTNPIIGMIHNVKDNRFHPVIFLYTPLPGGDDDNLHRHKSKGHHTVGFDTRELADENIKNELTQMVTTHYGEPKICNDLFPWDGDGVPAMVVFFGESDGKVIAMF